MTAASAPKPEEGKGAQTPEPPKETQDTAAAGSTETPTTEANDKPKKPRRTIGQRWDSVVKNPKVRKISRGTNKVMDGTIKVGEFVLVLAVGYSMIDQGRKSRSRKQETVVDTLNDIEEDLRDVESRLGNVTDLRDRSTSQAATA